MRPQEVISAVLYFVLYALSIPLLFFMLYQAIVHDNWVKKHENKGIVTISIHRIVGQIRYRRLELGPRRTLNFFYRRLGPDKRSESGNWIKFDDTLRSHDE